MNLKVYGNLIGLIRVQFDKLFKDQYHMIYIYLLTLKYDYYN